MLEIRIANKKEFSNDVLLNMHKLRARVFKERMGWDVQIKSGMEIDFYDQLEVLYMIISNTEGDICGCWRVLPTMGPYMLQNTFPQLLHGQLAPADDRIWELSRFAIETHCRKSYGFTYITLECIRIMMAYGVENGVERFVTVTTTAIERLLLKSGAKMQRVGTPMVIGIENAVALYLDTLPTYLELSKNIVAN